MATSEPIFNELTTECENTDIVEVESLCMKCKDKGITRLLLTKIPHYKEIIITSFECSVCGDKNNGVQSSSTQEHGVKFELTVNKNQDIYRQIVRSDFATVIIPELEFEIPADGQRGEVTTVEGIIQKAVAGLEQDQESRKTLNEDLYEKIKNFIDKLEDLLELNSPFTIVIDDPSGNSFVENLCTSREDPQLTITTYRRSKEQNNELGIYENINEETTPPRSLETVNEDEQEDVEGNLKEEVLQFNTICDQCSRPSKTKMKVTEIPHFKEVVIMASECEACGYKTNEVKSGAGIEQRGKKYTLHIQEVEDIARDVLKSETCSLSVPELELYVGAGVFVGKFTTVEGLLTDIKEDMKKNPFLSGDSAPREMREKIERLVADINKVIECKSNFHLVLDDPAGNSFLQDIYTPEEDPRLVVQEYDRTFEQNEELGLNDMKTENYTEET